MPFAYCRDPLFIVCFASYWINRWLESIDCGVWWATYYLNDVICIPFFVPMMVWATRRLGLRPDDLPPRVIEIIVPLIAWSILFEVILPSTSRWQGVAFADPYDVLAYTAGAAFSLHFWNWKYRPRNPRPATDEQCDD